MYDDVTAADTRSRDLGVLVGFDGSDHAKAALQFGASEALHRKTVLTVITVYTAPVPIYPNMASLSAQSEDRANRELAEATLDVAKDYLGDYSGEVILGVAQGNSTGTLAELTARAQLVVVGARGRGGFVGRVLGSVASALPAHAHCPTIVVPSTDSAEDDAKTEKFVDHKHVGPVVVAIDGSVQSAEVLEQAADAAERSATSLRILMIIPLAEEWLYWYPDAQLQNESSQRRKDELKKTIRDVHAWLFDEHPNLDISIDVEIGQPMDVISDRTATAALTVVGSRGRGAVRSALLGSVSRGVLNFAQGAVMIVPPQS